MRRVKSSHPDQFFPFQINSLQYPLVATVFCGTRLREFCGECWSHFRTRALLYRPLARTLILSQILPECLETTCDIGATSDDSFLVELPPWPLTKR